MLWCKVEHMLVRWITQECPSLHASLEGVREVWEITPLGYETADLKAPVGVEVIDYPIVALHSGQLLHDIGQMGGPVGTGAGLPQIPHEVSRRDDKRGQQRAHAMADVLVLALFRLARLRWLGRGGALQNLHARLCAGTDDEAPVVGEAKRIEIELTDIVCLRLEVGIVAIEPIHAPMRLDVCLRQDEPDTGPAHMRVAARVAE